MKIIFVCHGNICRSPMAEFIMKDLMKRKGMEDEFDISSAAVSYEEEGNGIYHYAANTLSRHGIPYGHHRAHRITVEEFRQADLVVIMDSSNERLLSRIVGGENMDKVHRMMEFAGSTRDVADPWYTGNFEQAFSDITTGCQALLNHLSKKAV